MRTPLVGDGTVHAGGGHTDPGDVGGGMGGGAYAGLGVREGRLVDADRETSGCAGGTARSVSECEYLWPEDVDVGDEGRFGRGRWRLCEAPEPASGAGMPAAAGAQGA